MAGLGDTLAAIVAARQSWRDRPHGGRLRDIAAFGHNPGALRMRIHVPEALAQTRSLVVVLHGCTQTAEDYAEGAGWLALADRMGFIVLCPEQLHANNPNLCFNWFQPGDTTRGEGEAASIRAMIQQAVSDHSVDRRRVFITGLSAGGAMAGAMLATYPEVFCAGAIVAGLPYGAASDVSEALRSMRAPAPRSARALGDAVRAASTHAGSWPRISVWHGDEDRIVSPAAGLQVAEQWADVHGVGERTVERSSGQPARRLTCWGAAEGQAMVELHRIAGMGHGVPISTAGADGCGAEGPYSLDVGISSTWEIAHSWGLEPAGALEPRGEVLERAADRKAATPPPVETILNAQGGDVGKLIAEALRRAGLMH